MTASAPLDVLDIPAADVMRHPAAVTDVREGRLTAVVVRGVYPADALTRATEELEQAAHGGPDEVQRLVLWPEPQPARRRPAGVFRGGARLRATARRDLSTGAGF